MEEEHYGNNWDLHAVVRFGCRRALSPPPRPDPIVPFMPPRDKGKAEVPLEKQVADAGWCFPDLGAGDRAGFGEDANELLKAFFAPPPPPPTLKPPTLTEQQQQQKQKQEMLQPLMIPAEAPLQSQTAAPARAQPSGRQASGAVPRSKRRKNQQKKVVCHVAADGVSSDVWAWRKYGQKPIKGSPYPRGYYRCSSSKGCPARKQVERSRADPNTFILTFTGEHNHAAPTHRNSLAGTSRNKFPSPSSSSGPLPQPPPPSLLVAGEAAAAHPSPPSTSTAGLSPTTPLRTTSMEEEDEEEEDELLVEDMEMAGEDDLLFLSGADSEDATPMSSLFDVDGPFLVSPWNGATADMTAAGAAAGAGS